MSPRLAFTLAAIVAALFTSPSSSVACDYCSIYSATKLHESEEGTLSLFLTNQHTSYKRTSRGNSSGPGSASPVTNGEFLEGYNTTLLTSQYDFTDAFGLLVSIPFIYRTGDRRESFRESSFSDSGIGDVALQVRYAPYVKSEVNTTTYIGLTGGVKLPTGESDGLRAVTPEASSAQALVGARHHTGGASGAQGRSFALGSGSTDLLLGATLYHREDRFFGLGVVNYTYRTEGTADFEFGDDIVWNVGPAHYLALTHESSLAIRIAVSGEHKGTDTRRGERIAGTKLSNFYVGPELIATLGDKWSGEVALDVPVSSNADDALFEPEMRVRASVGRRF